MTSRRKPYPKRDIVPTTLAIGLVALMLAAPAQAQRTSLESLAADHDDIQDVQNEGATPIFACGTIDTPGSYVVVQNLDAIGDCLVVAADNVTIDLGGHVLAGDGTGEGIKVSFAGAFRSNVAVRNGTVTGFGDGVALFGVVDARVSDVRALSNGGTGIRVDKGSTVTGCTAAENGDNGIQTETGSTVTGNTARNNGQAGIRVNALSTVAGNTAMENGSVGIHVFNNGGTVTGNTASFNDNVGLSILCPSNVIGNTALFNSGGNLILAGSGTCNDIDNLAP